MARYMSRVRSDAGAVTLARPMGRINRSPKHTWFVKCRPFEIQPCMLAPVLPGETLKNLVMQARVVTDPISNGLIGWWLDHMFFYVKHSQLSNASSYMSMHLDPTFDLTGIDRTAINFPKYVDVEQLDFVSECLNLVVEHYFRDEEDTATHDIGGSLPIAKVLADDWTDSLMTVTAAETDDVTVFTESGAGTLKASEIDTALRQWQMLRLNNLTTMDYEDYLQTFGIRSAEEVTDRPELIRHVREWQYPSNTIDPADGSAASAVSWAVQESANKARFFKEPGFIVGFMVARPKVYKTNMTGNAAGSLKDAYAWLPAVMRDDPMTSMREEAAGLGPLGDSTAAYVWDARDLFLYGDQFIGFPTDPQGATDINGVDLPANDLSNKSYPATAEVDALFANAAGGFKYVRADGVCSLTIAGTQVDHT